MNEEQLQSFRDWFQRHVATFREPDPAHQRCLDLKAEHTGHVCAAMNRITSDLGLPENDCRMASTTALFHDIGRFPQYQRYRTFRDPDSANHAKLSLWELNRHRVLHGLDAGERRLISRAIYFHNRLRLPENLDANTLLHCRLIRDADKVDILRVMLEHFQMEESRQNPVISLGLENNSGVRDEVFRCLFNKQPMSYTMLQTANELKMLQMSWVFDINFRPTFAILKERNSIGQLAATMPDTPRHRQALDFIQNHIETRLKGE